MLRTRQKSPHYHLGRQPLAAISFDAFSILRWPITIAAADDVGALFSRHAAAMDYDGRLTISDFSGSYLLTPCKNSHFTIDKTRKNESAIVPPLKSGALVAPLLMRPRANTTCAAN